MLFILPGYCRYSLWIMSSCHGTSPWGFWKNSSSSCPILPWKFPWVFVVASPSTCLLHAPCYSSPDTAAESVKLAGMCLTAGPLVASVEDNTAFIAPAFSGKHSIGWPRVLHLAAKTHFQWLAVHESGGSCRPAPSLWYCNLYIQKTDKICCIYFVVTTYSGINETVYTVAFKHFPHSTCFMLA